MVGRPCLPCKNTGVTAHDLNIKLGVGDRDRNLLVSPLGAKTGERRDERNFSHRCQPRSDPTMFCSAIPTSMNLSGNALATRNCEWRRPNLHPIRPPRNSVYQAQRGPSQNLPLIENAWSVSLSSAFIWFSFLIPGFSHTIRT